MKLELCIEHNEGTVLHSVKLLRLWAEKLKVQSLLGALQTNLNNDPMSTLEQTSKPCFKKNSVLGFPIYISQTALNLVNDSDLQHSSGLLGLTTSAIVILNRKNKLTVIVSVG